MTSYEDAFAAIAAGHGADVIDALAAFHEARKIARRAEEAADLKRLSPLMRAEIERAEIERLQSAQPTVEQRKRVKGKKAAAGVDGARGSQGSRGTGAAGKF